ncbi:isoprenyl transferase [Thorsellia kenyensis]|uniref:Ditrans,polycis-undecaprenyl-diphosphate synthase ((2E,6E)-farnesyl-diphosphate specific) n=1 Tax=Thorsellia kenyensis TaxID=1549888 RepID=A0ABV6CAQ7_9GAMM
MENLNIPEHVAIIMDGNGRWAKLRGKMRITGHRAGANAVRSTVRAAIKNNIKMLTLYAFSSENWKRPSAEVKALMELFLRSLKNEVPKLHENNIKLKIIGDVSAFSDRLQSEIKIAESLTEDNDGLILNIAANYGGRWDITHALKNITDKLKSGELDVNTITEKLIDNEIQQHSVPDVDLLIRTGGEFRVSNFLLWQIIYAELYFTDIYWPDFNEEAFNEAIKTFSQRVRRFGGI